MSLHASCVCVCVMWESRRIVKWAFQIIRFLFVFCMLLHARFLVVWDFKAWMELNAVRPLVDCWQLFLCSCVYIIFVCVLVANALSSINYQRCTHCSITASCRKWQFQRLRFAQARLIADAHSHKFVICIYICIYTYLYVYWLIKSDESNAN